MLGMTLGKAKAAGSFQFDYNYRSVEADAVIDAFTDSDSFGGGSNGKGRKLQAKYQMAKNWQAQAFGISCISLSSAGNGFIWMGRERSAIVIGDGNFRVLHRVIFRTVY
jgi:hypothetical protein